MRQSGMQKEVGNVLGHARRGGMKGQLLGAVGNKAQPTGQQSLALPRVCGRAGQVS